MYIRRLVIRNFRAISHLDIELKPGLTCLIGANNSGKTTVLHAIRLVLDANLPSAYRSLGREDFSVGVDVTQPQQVLVAVELADFKRSVEAEAFVSDWTIGDDVAGLCYRFRPDRQSRSALADGTIKPGSLGIENYHWQIGGTGGFDPATMNWDDDPVGTVSFDRLSTFQITFLQALRDVEDDLRRQRYSPLAKLLESANLSETQKEALLSRLRNANSDIRGDETVKNLGKTINASLSQTLGDTFKLEVDVGVADPTFAALARSLVLLLTSRGLSSADPARNGLGLNNALYISMLMEVFRQRSVQPGVSGQLLLAEEPEAHLHPELQRIVFDSLQDSGYQTIATTHSTHITSRAPLENVVVLTSDTDPVTTAVVPRQIGHLTENEQRDLERYLDATRSTLLFARRVILVEGMSEVFLIPPLVKAVLGIDLQREGISVIAIHGTHFDSYAKLFANGGLRKRCAVLTDGDRPIVLAEEGDEDEAPDSEGERPSVEALRKLEGDFLKVFTCDSTFEVELATPGNLKMFAAAARHLGAKRVASSLEAVVDTSAKQASAAKTTLRAAKRFGKARFAQVASEYNHLASDVPSYIREAVLWARG